MVVGRARRRADRLHALAASARPIAPDAPSLPITVGGVAFNVPPAAIRFKVQRRPGAQARIDLSFRVAVARAARQPASSRPPTDPPDVTNRLFVTIAAADGTLPPVERLKVIYPRYLTADAVVGPDGLSVQGIPRRHRPTRARI